MADLSWDEIFGILDTERDEDIVGYDSEKAKYLTEHVVTKVESFNADKVLSAVGNPFDECEIVISEESFNISSRKCRYVNATRAIAALLAGKWELVEKYLDMGAYKTTKAHIQLFYKGNPISYSNYEAEKRDWLWRYLLIEFTEMPEDLKLRLVEQLYKNAGLPPFEWAPATVSENIEAKHFKLGIKLLEKIKKLMPSCFNEQMNDAVYTDIITSIFNAFTLEGCFISPLSYEDLLKRVKALYRYKGRYSNRLLDYMKNTLYRTDNVKDNVKKLKKLWADMTGKRLILDVERDWTVMNCLYDSSFPNNSNELGTFKRMLEYADGTNHRTDWSCPKSWHKKLINSGNDELLKLFLEKNLITPEEAAMLINECIRTGCIKPLPLLILKKTNELGTVCI